MAVETQTGWAEGFIDALVSAGVRHLVLSPGSRSTPFALAAVSHPGLACHAVIDERSAGFFALGQAKSSSRPSALLSTSGSAGAHYLPALIEAAYSFTPLVVITADRPPELHSCGAPQAIDQVKLFGDFVRHYVDLGGAEARVEALRAVRRKAVQAVARSLAPVPGPVHINAPARKPLAPREARRKDHDQAREELGEGFTASAPRVFPSRRAPDAAGIAELAAACRQTERGLIVAGPAPIAQGRGRAAVDELAARTGFPVLAEAASQWRFRCAGTHAEYCDGFDALLRSPRFVGHCPPDLILQLGVTPVSTGWWQYVAAHPVPRYVIAPYGWQDPHNSATALLEADVTDALEALNAALPLGPRRATPWSRAFAAGNELVWDLVEELAVRDELSEGAVARATVESLPPGGLLAVGNSLPIRSVDTFCRGGAAEIDVLSQRGASGIDGLLCGAAGAASVAERPVALLIGDVSFHHDLTGLALVREAVAPLAIVVVDNRGGRIFEQLPIAESTTIAPVLERYWLTPPPGELEHAAKSFGVGYARADEPSAMRRALDGALARPGCTLVHARVAPSTVTEQYRRLWGAVDARIEARLAPADAPVLAGR